MALTMADANKELEAITSIDQLDELRDIISRLRKRDRVRSCILPCTRNTENFEQKGKRQDLTPFFVLSHERNAIRN